MLINFQFPLLHYSCNRCHFKQSPGH